MTNALADFINFEQIRRQLKSRPVLHRTYGKRPRPRIADGPFKGARSESRALAKRIWRDATELRIMDELAAERSRIEFMTEKRFNLIRYRITRDEAKQLFAKIPSIAEFAKRLERVSAGKLKSETPTNG